MKRDMNTLGLIGGTTWVSTMDYYRIINEEVNKILGGNNSAKLFLYSINFQDAVDLNVKKDTAGMKRLVLDAVKAIVGAGADGLMLCANTLYKFADDIEKEFLIPLIHIADETSKEIIKTGVKKAGLMGTLTTMEEPFYRDRLRKSGIETIIPEVRDRHYIHDSIYHDFSKGIFKKEAKEQFLKIIDDLHEKGAEGIILGCTEIPLLLNQADTDVPLFDTLKIHASAGARFVAGN